MTKYDALHQTRQIVKVFVVEKKGERKSRINESA